MIGVLLVGATGLSTTVATAAGAAAAGVAAGAGGTVFGPALTSTGCSSLATTFTGPPVVESLLSSAPTSAADSTPFSSGGATLFGPAAARMNGGDLGPMDAPPTLSQTAPAAIAAATMTSPPTFRRHAPRPCGFVGGGAGSGGGGAATSNSLAAIASDVSSNEGRNAALSECRLRRLRLRFWRRRDNSGTGATGAGGGACALMTLTSRVSSSSGSSTLLWFVPAARRRRSNSSRLISAIGRAFMFITDVLAQGLIFARARRKSRPLFGRLTKCSAAAAHSAAPH